MFKQSVGFVCSVCWKCPSCHAAAVHLACSSSAQPVEDTVGPRSAGQWPDMQPETHWALKRAAGRQRDLVHQVGQHAVALRVLCRGRRGAPEEEAEAAQGTPSSRCPSQGNIPACLAQG